jgi:hypothetical protein
MQISAKAIRALLGRCLSSMDAFMMAASDGMAHTSGESSFAIYRGKKSAHLVSIHRPVSSIACGP